MTTVADLISPADRARLLKRLAEWRELDGAMRERGSLAALPPPRPLHKMASAAAPATATTTGRRTAP